MICSNFFQNNKIQHFKYSDYNYSSPLRPLVLIEKIKNRILDNTGKLYCIMNNIIDKSIFFTCLYKYYTFRYKISIIESEFNTLNYIEFLMLDSYNLDVHKESIENMFYEILKTECEITCREESYRINSRRISPSQIILFDIEKIQPSNFSEINVLSLIRLIEYDEKEIKLKISKKIDTLIIILNYVFDMNIPFHIFNLYLYFLTELHRIYSDDEIVRSDLFRILYLLHEITLNKKLEENENYILSKKMISFVKKN